MNIAITFSKIIKASKKDSVEGYKKFLKNWWLKKKAIQPYFQTRNQYKKGVKIIEPLSLQRRFFELH